MQDTVFYVGGSKGGVGKSIISIALVQFLIERFAEKKSVHLIETDHSNPDVGRIYKGMIPVTAIALDERETGWIKLFEQIEQNRDTLFVINSAAMSKNGIEANGENFSAALEDESVPYNLVTLWPINRQPDCIELLIDYLKHVSYGYFYTVRNNYWGLPEDFILYDNAAQSQKHRAFFKSRVNGILDFPSLNDLIAQSLYQEEAPIPQVAAKMNVFNRQVLGTWQRRAFEMFSKMDVWGDSAEVAPES